MCACALFSCWRSDVRMSFAPLIEVRIAHAPCFPTGGQLCACALLLARPEILMCSFS
jgi:hypothetical protein